MQSAVMKTLTFKLDFTFCWDKTNGNSIKFDPDRINFLKQLEYNPDSRAWLSEFRSLPDFRFFLQNRDCFYLFLSIFDCFPFFAFKNSDTPALVLPMAIKRYYVPGCNVLQCLELCYYNN